MEDKQIFNEVFQSFQSKYQHRNLEMHGTIVYVDGNAVFNTDGFNLLYNLKRLVAELEDELL